LLFRAAGPRAAARQKRLEKNDMTTETAIDDQPEPLRDRRRRRWLARDWRMSRRTGSFYLNLPPGCLQGIPNPFDERGRVTKFERQ
jgi:hypothetical protein